MTEACDRLAAALPAVQPLFVDLAERHARGVVFVPLASRPFVMTIEAASSALPSLAARIRREVQQSTGLVLVETKNSVVPFALKMQLAAAGAVS